MLKHALRIACKYAYKNTRNAFTNALCIVTAHSPALCGHIPSIGLCRRGWAPTVLLRLFTNAKRSRPGREGSTHEAFAKKHPNKTNSIHALRIAFGQWVLLSWDLFMGGGIFHGI